MKKAAAYGQDDLFGATRRRRATTRRAFGLDFPIGETEWPRKQLLATEREMLGLYVSAHPLDGAEHILARTATPPSPNCSAPGRTRATSNSPG